jgi:hypothetical protein
MPVAWFLVPYVQRLTGPGRTGPNVRYCQMNDFTEQIRADGGDWREVEILDPGMGRAIVKVRASVPTLTTIADTFTRIPLTLLDEPLSSLPNAVRNAIRNQVLACGYTTAEVNARFPNIANNTLGDVLRFMATRKRKARFNGTTIVCDGDEESCESVDTLDTDVT